MSKTDAALSRFKVPVTRTECRTKTFEVFAHNSAEAKRLALQEASAYLWYNPGKEKLEAGEPQEKV